MPESPTRSSLVWFRRDLRIDDHVALAAASRCGGVIYGCFVFDRGLLDPLEDRADRRVSFIRAALAELQAAWQRIAADSASGRPASGVRLVFLHGDPAALIPLLAERLGVDAVFASRDYEPAAKLRDAAIANTLQAAGRRLELLKDQVVFESGEVLTADGRPFSVFTPYRNAWRKRLRLSDLLPREIAAGGFRLGAPPAIAGELLAVDGAPALGELGFVPAPAAPGVVPGISGAGQAWAAFMGKLDEYPRRRDFPAAGGTSRLSVHLRFGTISVRALARMAWQLENGSGSGSAGAGAWLDELIWREFYMAILDACPWVVAHCWRRQYDALRWDDAPELFAAWCTGQTGYPLVDAAMRELVGSGFMHNRTRMVVASFLSKDLGIDWRLGERFFARHLLDYDLAANNGGWQWAASTGCDAQPYFRIFNPVTQSEKFDPGGDYIRCWVPELARVPLPYLHAPWKMPPRVAAAAGVRLGVDYPLPVVDHAAARLRTLARYAAARHQG